MFAEVNRYSIVLLTRLCIRIETNLIPKVAVLYKNALLSYSRAMVCMLDAICAGQPHLDCLMQSNTENQDLK